MPTFFRQEKRPFTYMRIETRTSKTNYAGWIIGVCVVIVLAVGAYLIFT